MSEDHRNQNANIFSRS